MIKEIRYLILDLLRIRVLGGNDDLCRFLAQFLKDLVQTLIEQVIGVGTFLWVFLPVADNVKYILKHPQKADEEAMEASKKLTIE